MPPEGPAARDVDPVQTEAVVDRRSVQGADRTAGRDIGDPGGAAPGPAVRAHLGVHPRHPRPADAVQGRLQPPGIGAGRRARTAARTALRFTTPREPVVHYTGLGALALLAEIPREVSRGNADVAAIARLAGHPDDLETLGTYCATGSLRRAADLLHLHHSSVARRLEQIARTLGIDLTEPAGLTRARLALTAWRLLDD
ncbi:helix-turn-helix domain-containing protein [Streptomyces sp. NPDC051041]|uniref:helix-turn-helix domain-containing protein n=1 Tax=Streptomyces sp. NPDC051041 TaxID=3365640 RepID=UPI00378E12A4